MRKSHAVPASAGAKYAASRSAAMPQESDDSRNSTGTSGELHKATAPVFCSSKPVYSMTTTATTAAAASTARTAPRGTLGR